jgi:hypothetical protein
LKEANRAEHHVLNLGAGVQSTTVYLMYVRGEVTPPIECAIFADTGEEPVAIYRHLEWLKSLNGPPIVSVSIGKLGDDLQQGRNSTGQRFASIPSFTAAREGHKVGIVRRQCTREYKIDPIERYIRGELLGMARGQRVPAGTMVHQSYGISLDEAGRSVRIRERLAERHWLTPVFPLLDRQMTRGDCYRWLAGIRRPTRGSEIRLRLLPVLNRTRSGGGCAIPIRKAGVGRCRSTRHCGFLGTPSTGTWTRSSTCMPVAFRLKRRSWDSMKIRDNTISA